MKIKKKIDHIALFLIMYLKIFIAYEFLGHPNPLAILITTTIVLSVSYLLLNKNILAFSAFDFILSFILIIDINYYGYYNVYPSITYLSLLDELVAAGSSLSTAIMPASFLFFANIPLYFFADSASKELSKKQMIKVLLVLLLPLIFLIPFNYNVSKIVNIQSSELITYHVRDIIGLNYEDNSGEEYIEVQKPEDNTEGAEDTEDTEKTENNKGIAEGKNLVIIQLEAFENFLINLEYNGEEVTPNLNALIENDSYYFENFFQTTSIGNTSDAEFTVLTSMYPNLDKAVFTTDNDKNLYSLPKILNDEGYYTFTSHVNDATFYERDKMYPALGFDDYLEKADYTGEELPEGFIIDEYFFEQTADYITGLEEPFFGMLISLSTHYPYDIGSDESIRERYFDIAPEHEGYPISDYINACRYTDEQLGVFMQKLKDTGVYEDCIFVIYGDHQAVFSNTDIEYALIAEIIGSVYDERESTNIPLIINIPASGINETIDTYTGQIDLMPTILNLMGIEITNPVSVFGVDALNSNRGYAPIISYCYYGSFVNDKMFIKILDGNGFSNAENFDASTDKDIDINDYENIYTEIKINANNSKYLLNKDEVFKQENIYDEYDGNEGYEDIKSELIQKIYTNPETFVACAGGVIDGYYPGTNCKNVLDQSVEKGFRYIEVDFMKTVDNMYILLNGIHELNGYFAIESLEGLTHEKFMNTDMIWELEQLDLESLAKWMRENSEIKIITDIKSDNVSLLQRIDSDCPDIKDNFIVQIYSLDEYQVAKDLGFEKIIYNTDRMDDTYDEVVKFIEDGGDLFSVAITAKEVESDFFDNLLALNQSIHVFTINDVLNIDEMLKCGANGVYCDYIISQED